MKLDSLVAEKKMYRVMRLIIILKHKRLTVNQIASEIEVQKRTAYRYLNLLQSLKIEIECDFDNKYFITSDCPICGSTTNNHKHLKTSGSIIMLDK